MCSQAPSGASKVSTASCSPRGAARPTASTARSRATCPRCTPQATVSRHAVSIRPFSTARARRERSERASHRAEAPMKWDVRPCASVDELRAAVAPIWQYFGLSVPTDEQFDRVGRILPPERMDAAWEKGRAVGGAGALPFTLTIPGARIPAAGVTAVAVLPTHRRRGILTALMRAQLDGCQRRGEPVAYLWATEDTIYGRFGYGVASFTAEIDVARERTAFHR